VTLPSLAPEANPMKTSSIRFSDLRRLLLDLRFDESKTDAYWRFEHHASGAVFLFRPLCSA
jgi:hypothetical protein